MFVHRAPTFHCCVAPRTPNMKMDCCLGHNTFKLLYSKRMRSVRYVPVVVFSCRVSRWTWQLATSRHSVLLAACFHIALASCCVVEEHVSSYSIRHTCEQFQSSAVFRLSRNKIIRGRGTTELVIRQSIYETGVLLFQCVNLPRLWAVLAMLFRVGEPQKYPLSGTELGSSRIQYVSR